MFLSSYAILNASRSMPSYRDVTEDRNIVFLFISHQIWTLRKQAMAEIDHGEKTSSTKKKSSEI